MDTSERLPQPRFRRKMRTWWGLPERSNRSQSQVSLPWVLQALGFYMVTQSNYLCHHRVTKLWAVPREPRQSLVVSPWQQARNYLQRAKVTLTSIFPCPAGKCPSRGPDKTLHPWTVRRLCRAAKSTKTTAQSQTVNTSTDGPLLSVHQATKLFLGHRQQLGENKYLSTYVYTRRWGGWSVKVDFESNKLAQNPQISSWHWLGSSAGWWSCKPRS